ncbi:hypothetical protein RUMOBE_00405 [Blautia obeum ATCC 29174]|uniref:Uncharacterized protein n=1 Tax=Blautia obeum ATCC 29174 TaxID=411459 RepID=A5ZN37_9FIRM|nr:hypothetical protein RUMOBE_00405 [Blautia obeum ATCC 29174]
MIIFIIKCSCAKSNEKQMKHHKNCIKYTYLALAVA